MTSFIKFTETSCGLTGQDRRLWFINADQIASAVFIEKTNQLQIVLAGKLERARFTIEGKEAEEVLAVLQKL